MTDFSIGDTVTIEGGLNPPYSSPDRQFIIECILEDQNAVQLRDVTSPVPRSRVSLVKHTNTNIPEKLIQSLNGENGIDQQDIARAGVELVVKVLTKNADYGSSVFESPCLSPNTTPLEALRSRQSDKVKRIIQLAANPPEVTEEALEDSLDDFAGYNILDKVLRERNSNENS